MAGIADQFMSVLGRAPTQDEISYFQKFIDDSQLAPHEVGQVLQSTPEYQQSQLQKNTDQFGERLNAQNGAILDQAGAAINSRFAGLGRPNTSAMGASLMQAGGQLAQQRQGALASFYGQGLQNNAALGAQQGQQALQRGYDIRTEGRQRQYQIQDYYRQKNDAADYEHGHSGWNAITPEFVIGSSLGVAGKVGAGYAGGRAAAGKGLF